ncbi:SDR family NAD(P)-dependent oxidoreductase [Agromyces sp. MMS24-JH15]|uniref:SDR family NAD(P)-dependent oxidoreductase n=1 Tax=Agromyces sp. MMS24-JH15 TaxID=3243765 RepID=UPI00374819C4
MPWNPIEPPDQRGRVHVVTGSTAGIGYFAAEQLAGTGAHVVLAARSPEKLGRARDSIRSQVPGSTVSTVVLDLADLGSVRRAGTELAAFGRIDGLLLNGGTMAPAAGATTVDGLPLMLGTHVIAGVALTGLLLPTLAATGEAAGTAARIVHTSTGFVRRLKLDVDAAARPQRGFLRDYTWAKTVTELHAYELDRRLRAAGVPVASIVAHPGIGVDAKTPARDGVHDPRGPRRRNPFTPWAQGKDAAAWPAVRALTDPALAGGEYLGPEGGRRGAPVVLEPNPLTARADPARVARVWDELESLAGVPVGV